MVLQEIRWTGKRIWEKQNYRMYSSCNSNEHIFGTGFIVSDRIKRLIINFRAVNEIMYKIRMKGTFLISSIINVHAPKEENEDEKEAFYGELESCIQECPKNYIKIIIGCLLYTSRCV